MTPPQRRREGPPAPNGVDASWWATPSRALITLSLGVVLAFASSGAAEATVRAAVVTDPAGDAALDGSSLTSPPIEFTQVSVEYDDQTGRVNGSYTFAQTPRAAQTVWAGIGLGVLAPDGSCNAPNFVPRRSGAIGGWETDARQGQAVVQGYWNDGANAVRAAFYGGSPPLFWEDRPPLAYDWVGAPKQVFNFAAAKPEFAGRGYTCARFASAARDSSGGSVDQLDGHPVALSVAPDPEIKNGPTPNPLPPGAVPPRTVITGGPVDGDQTRESTARFSFTADRSVTFRCRLYPASGARPGFGECTGSGSHTVRALAPDTYVFEVMATDGTGLAEPAPARRVFTILPAEAAAPGEKVTAVGGSTRTLFFSVNNVWQVSGRRTRILTLQARGVPKRTTAVITCKGPGCPFRRKAFAPAKGSRIRLLSAFRRRTLRSGITISITFDIPGAERRRVQFKTRADLVPLRTDFCPKPNGKGFRRCR